MRVYEEISRYFLGLWFMVGAVEGLAYLLLGEQFVDMDELSPFLVALMTTTYFWAFLKFIQLVAAISLLANYKPALGLALVTPVSAILFLFYLFEFPVFLPFGILIAVSTGILFRKYYKSFSGLLLDYPRDATKVESVAR